MKGLRRRDVKAAVEGVLEYAAFKARADGSFKLEGLLNLKLDASRSTALKPTSKTLRAIPLKRLNDTVKY